MYAPVTQLDIRLREAEERLAAIEAARRATARSLRTRPGLLARLAGIRRPRIETAPTPCGCGEAA
jgi:hypothetical protein